MIRGFLICLMLAASAHAQVVVPGIVAKSAPWTPATADAEGALEYDLQEGDFSSPTWTDSSSNGADFDEISGTPTVCSGCVFGLDAVDFSSAIDPLESSGGGSYPSSFAVAWTFEHEVTEETAGVGGHGSSSEDRWLVNNLDEVVCHDGTTPLKSSTTVASGSDHWAVCVYDGSSSAVYVNSTSADNTGTLSPGGGSGKHLVGGYLSTASYNIKIGRIFFVDLTAVSDKAATITGIVEYMDATYTP